MPTTSLSLGPRAQCLSACLVFFSSVVAAIGGYKSNLVYVTVFAVLCAFVSFITAILCLAQGPSSNMSILPGPGANPNRRSLDNNNATRQSTASDVFQMDETRPDDTRADAQGTASGFRRRHPRRINGSSPSDGSDTDAEDLPIILENIPTLAQLFKQAVIKAVEKPKYPVDSALLDRISLFQGDITKLSVDSIVNAAKKSLLGGGGVDGAIHAAAGRGLLEECRGLNGCETGESKITKGYKLLSKHIIHTVGPIYSSKNRKIKAEQLASCYRTSLELAVKNSLKHIAFPSISTGIYGYPIEDATHLALKEVRQFVTTEPGSTLERVIFVVWSNKDKDVYQELLPEYFPPSGSSEPKGEE